MSNGRDRPGSGADRDPQVPNPEEEGVSYNENEERWLLIGVIICIFLAIFCCIKIGRMISNEHLKQATERAP